MSDTLYTPHEDALLIVETRYPEKPFIVGKDPLKKFKPTDEEVQEWVDAFHAAANPTA